MTPWAVLMGKQPTVENLKAGAKATFGEENIDELFRLYGITTDKDVLEQPGVNLASDIFLDYSTWKWGNMHKLTSGQPVYRYRYCHPRPAMAIKGKVAAPAGGVIDAKEGEAPAPQDKGCRTLCRYRVCHGHSAYQPCLQLATCRLHDKRHLQPVLHQL